MGIGTRQVANTAFYPPRMVQRIVQVWKQQWYRTHDSLVAQEFHILCDSPTDELLSLEELFGTEEPRGHKRKADDLETVIPSTDKERTRVLLSKIHKAAGHPSNRNLARLCRDRGLPQWVIDEALKLQCEACIQTQRGGQMVIHRSLGEKPRPWQFVVMDVFEIPFPAKQIKGRFLLAACLTTQFVSVHCLHVGDMSSSGTDPGHKIIDAFCKMWMMHRPKPQWIVTDAQTSLCYGKFAEFAQMVGIGMSVAAPEAHWQNGVAESLIRVTKNTIRKLRYEFPDFEPATIGAMAAYANNHAAKVKGFSPVQWAYGVDPDNWDGEKDPLSVNTGFQFGPEEFVKLQSNREKVSEIHRKVRADENWTRLANSSTRPATSYQPGDFVCIWRTGTLKARKKTKEYNPEPRFIGPGRVVFVEPAINPDGRSAVIWVLMGVSVYRCSPEQLRLATDVEITAEMLRKNKLMSVPKEDMIRQLKSFVDVTIENADIPPAAGATHADEAIPGLMSPDEWPQQQPQPARSSADRKRRVDELRERWDQLVSINEARRREGLPPMMNLPGRSQPRLDPGQSQPMVMNMEETDATIVTESPEYTSQKQEAETEELKQVVMTAFRAEQQLIFHLQEACMKPESDEGSFAYFIEFDIDDPDEFTRNSLMYVKKVLESKGTEVNYRRLTPEDQKLFDEAMAKEVVEVVKSMALRALRDRQERAEAESSPERHIPMRWLLTWKPVVPPEPPARGQPTVLTKDGRYKAKARVVLIGYKHPDLVTKNPVTGKPELQTSSPTISRSGKFALLQAAAFDMHTLECADAKSAFLQAENKEEKRRLWTRAVAEISLAMNLSVDELKRIMGAIYGLTNAPRIFWADADTRMKRLGGKANPFDRCVWIFRNSQQRVCGRVGAQVDDFLICGDASDPYWINIREEIKMMYDWSPWKKGDFIYSGSRITQMSTYSIRISQEDFCNGVSPVEIASDKSRSDTDKMTAKEISQCRALLMKCQWRAIQSGPQFCARIGIANSRISEGTIALLREANSIVREIRKTAKEDIIFHSFNFGRSKKYEHTDLIFVHWGDASHSRPGGGHTGGFVTGLSTPEILTGEEAPVSLLDWRSWKLRRTSAGSNSSEGQAICESEDKGWKMRIMWQIMYGATLQREKAKQIAAMNVSLLIMDSKGCYDALTCTETPGASVENARTSVDMIAVSEGLNDESNCYATWVPSDLNLADALTKHTPEANKVMALYHSRKTWVVRFNESFVSARKAQKARRAKAMQERAEGLHLADLPLNWSEDTWLERFGEDITK